MKTMLPFKPLLAVDWIEIIIFLFIVVSSLIGQLFKSVQDQKRKRQKGKGKRQAPVPPVVRQPPAGAPVAGAPAAGGAQTSLEKEIEAFLRKTVGGKPAEQARPLQPPAAGTARKRPLAERPPTVRRAPQPPPRQPTSDFPARESVGEHVQRHVRKGGVAERDAHLGDLLEQADERMESHLQQVFEHRLGTLQGEAATPADRIAQGTDSAVWQRAQAAHPLASQLFEMLSTPQHLQAAIVLSEVLRRPEERWS
jgi:hypothetical protein